MVTLNKNLTLEMDYIQKNQRSGIGFTDIFEKIENYDNVVNL